MSYTIPEFGNYSERISEQSFDLTRTKEKASKSTGFEKIKLITSAAIKDLSIRVERFVTALFFGAIMIPNAFLAIATLPLMPALLFNDNLVSLFIKTVVGGLKDEANLFGKSLLTFVSPTAMSTPERQADYAKKYLSGPDKNLDKVFELSQAAINKKLDIGYYLQARVYEEGTTSILKNEEKAIRLYTLASEGNTAAGGEASYRLGMAHFKETHGVKLDLDEALRFMNKAASLNHPDAHQALGEIYLAKAERYEKANASPGIIHGLRRDAILAFSVVAEKDPKAAFELVNLDNTMSAAVKEEYLNLAAKAKIPEAQVQLGKMKLAAGNVDMARDLFISAASSGNQEAQFNLGKLYWDATGSQRNIVQAVIWLEKAVVSTAVKTGSTEAKALLGKIYSEGAEHNPIVRNKEVIPQDLKRASELLTEASRAGDVSAKTQLGILYQKGLYTDASDKKHKDMNKAKELFYAAAKEKNVEAQVELAGIKLAAATGKSDDHLFERAKALKLLDSAAEKQDPKANFILAERNLRLKEKSPETLLLARAQLEAALRHADNSALYYAQAAYLYADMAKKGQADLVNMFGRADETKALSWFRVAANKGHFVSQVEAARLLIAENTPASKAEALKLLKLAKKKTPTNKAEKALMGEVQYLMSEIYKSRGGELNNLRAVKALKGARSFGFNIPGEVGTIRSGINKIQNGISYAAKGPSYVWNNYTPDVRGRLKNAYNAVFSKSSDADDMLVV